MPPSDPTPGDATEKDQTLNLVLRGEIEQLVRRAAERRAARDFLGAVELLEKASERLSAPRSDRRAAARVDLALADVLFDEGRIDLGIARLERAFKLDPDLTEAVEAGRRMYRMLGDWALVARLYEVELESTTAPPQRRRTLWSELGRIRAERLSDPTGAVEALEEAVGLGADDAPTLELLASLHLAEDPAPAATLFYQLGMRVDGAERIRYLRRALGADAFHAPAATALEEAYRARGATDELLQLYRMPGAPSEQPGWAARRARAFAERGLLDAAEEAARVALAEGAGPLWVDEFTVAAEAGGKRPIDVARLHRRLLDEALAWDPQPAAVEWSARMRAAAARAQNAGALSDEELARKRAYELDPDGAFVELAEMLARRRDAAGLRALGDESDVHERLEMVADLLDKKLGDARGATAVWRRAESLAPSPRGPIELRRLQQKEDRWSSAEAALLRELEKSTARADVLRRLAQLDRDRHQLDDAAARIVEALADSPDDPPLLRAEAELFEARGRFVEARASLARLAKLPSLERAERLNVLRRLLQLSHERLDDPSAVVDAARMILVELPSDRDALGHLETVARRQKDHGALLEALDRHAAAAALPAERVPLLVEAATLAEALGDVGGAKERLERASRMGAPSALAALGRLQAKLGLRAEALMTWDRVPKAESAALRRPRARVLDELGETARAVAAWREVLTDTPGDREALLALGRHSTDPTEQAEVLRLRAERAEPDEAAALWLARARLLSGAAGIAAYRQLLDGPAPGHPEALAELRALLVDNGLHGEAARSGEVAFVLTSDDDERLALAMEIAVLHRAGGDLARAERAYRRVLDLDPQHDGALEALSSLYAARGAWPEVMATDERRLALTHSVEERVALSFALARTAEEQLAKPERAFQLLHDVYRLLPSDGTLAELRRLAERHALWEQLIAVYGEGGEGGDADAVRRQAEVIEQRLSDPARAFFVLAESPRAEHLAEMERLAARAASDEVWDGLLRVYDDFLQRNILGRAELYRRRAEVKELELGDPDGAFDESLRRLAIEPADETAVGEVRRLAEKTERWEDLVAAQAFRFERAAGALRLQIALEAARLVEERLGDKRRAFRAYLRALTLAPTSIEVRDELWRLGRILAEPDTSKVPVKPAAPSTKKPAPAKPTPATKPGSQPARPSRPDATRELRLEDVMVDESGPIPLPRRPPRPDATVELSIEDVIGSLPPRSPEATAKPQHPTPNPTPNPTANPTIELGIIDLEASRPPPIPAPLTAWQELALVLGRPLHSDEEPAAVVRAQAAVAEMWECGAGLPGPAFEALLVAFAADPSDADLVEELDRLATLANRFDALRTALAGAVDDADSPERAVRLLLQLASLCERRHLDDEAESHYLRALGIRPDEPDALGRLEAVYRRRGRDRELANLLERRLNGLIERMPPGAERQARAVELADIYERLGQTYEAIGAWRRVADESPDSEPAEEALARLYERTAQWSKVVEALVQLADLREHRDHSDGKARAARRRVGDIYARELELADRAADVYERLAHDAVGAEAVELEDELESLYQQLGRTAALEALLARKTARVGATPELLQRRAALLEKLGDHPRTAQLLAELAKLEPSPELDARLADALGRAGRPAEQLAVLRARLVGLQGPERNEVELTCARLLLAVPSDGNRNLDEARAIVERVLAEAPSHGGALELHLRLQAGPAGYAAALERRAEAGPEGERAQGLRAAAIVYRDEAGDPVAARRCLERALAAGGDADVVADLIAVVEAAGDLDGAAALAERELAGAPSEKRQATLHGIIGRARLAAGNVDAAARAWRHAVSLDPQHADAALGLAELAAAAGHWDEVEALLQPRASDGKHAAASYRNIARLATVQGRPDEALQALLEADRLAPGDLATRMDLCANRFAAHRYREAAQWAQGLSARADLSQAPREAATALYRGAVAELKLRREERALPLLRQALALDPGNQDALGLLIERLVDKGELDEVLPLCRAHAVAAADDATRARRWERVGDLLQADATRAEAYLAAVAASGPDAPESLVDKAFHAARAAHLFDDAARLGTLLLARPAAPAVRAARLTEAATLDEMLGNPERAEARLTEAHGLAPADEATLDALSALLSASGKHQAAAQLLTRALGLLPSTRDRKRATLWERLGLCRERLRDPQHAAQAYERALELDPARQPLREWLVERYRSDGNQAQAATHLAAILQETPRALGPLRALLEHTTDGNRRRRLLEILALDGLSAPEATLLAALRQERDDTRLPGILDEADHEALAPAEARALGPVMAALWEGLGASKGFPSLTLPETRISTVGTDALSRDVAVCLRALGNQRTGVYRGASDGDLTLSPQPPTALVVHPLFAERHGVAARRFLLGRALELLRPEYVLAATMPAKDFTQLFGQVLAAFHPRHVGTHKADADELRRRLPYKVARRLADLFEVLRDTEFSSVLWRHAVQTAAARAGLVVAGDLQAATVLLDAEGDRAQADDLLRFGLSDDFLALRARLWM